MNILLFFFKLQNVTGKRFSPNYRRQKWQDKGVVSLREVGFEPFCSSLSSNQTVKFPHLQNSHSADQHLSSLIGYTIISGQTHTEQRTVTDGSFTVLFPFVQLAKRFPPDFSIITYTALPLAIKFYSSLQVIDQTSEL